MSTSLPTRPARLMLSLLVLALVVPLLVGVPADPAGAQPQVVAGAPLAPADGEPDVTIRRTSFWIPHIVARDWTSLGYGNGYATAEDAICNLADTLVTARGERSRYFGPEETYDDQVTLNATNLQVDTLVTALRDRGTVEALMEVEGAAPSERIQAIIAGYVDGVKRYLEDIGGADAIADPRCSGGEWITDAVENADEIDLYYGIYLANLLASAGVFVPGIADATPPSADDPGTPVDPGVIGIPLPPGGEAEFTADYDPATLDLDLIDRDALLAGLGKDPDAPFGSNGTAIGGDLSDTGRGQVLGNPHFPWKGRYRFHQAQLTIPGVYDVAGGMLTGSPVVNIGWNNDVAWTHTVSTAYRFTPYEYQLVGPTTYLTESGPAEVERQEVTIDVLMDDGSVEEVTDDVYRTNEGLVLDQPDIFLGWSLNSVWAIRDANAEHLRTLDVFLEFGDSDSVESLLAAHTRTGGLPWVNTLAADRDGNALYADHSVVPHVTDAMVQTCATPTGQILFELAGLPGLDGTRAQSTCAWGADDDAARDGIFGFENLPSVITRDWVINANDSYWLPNPELPLEGFARIIGCEQCERTLRTRMVYRYLLDRKDGTDGLGPNDTVTHEQLREFQTGNRVYGYELAMENDDLLTACADSGVREEACQVLADWDGRTDIDSVGAVLFRELWLNGADVFEEAFDADDAANTPRNLDESSADVQQAIVDAVAALDEAGVALDATLGSQQVAADDPETLGEGIPIHGGVGGTGSANVIAIRNPFEGADERYQVGYGSSHIQAVTFTDEGVEANTILTYGNADDPTSPHTDDQTKLWSAEQWVDWPYTHAEQIASPGYHAYRVTDTDGRTDLTAEDAARDPADTDDVTADTGLRTDRIAGATRYETAVEVSRRTFATADTAVVANGEGFADALAGAPLAAELDGPLLLTQPGAVPAVVMAELDRLGVRDVVLLGGPVTLGPEVEAQLTSAGLEVRRVAGATRYETAAAAAAEVGDGSLVFVASGENAADALSAAGLAASLGAPVVLVQRDVLPEAAAALLAGADQVVIAGGIAAVSESVAAQIAELATGVIRAAGADRYATSVSLLNTALDLGLAAPSSLWIASGETFADALAAGPSAGVLSTGVLLVNPAGDAATQIAALDDIDPRLILVAGGPAALPDSAIE